MNQVEEKQFRLKIKKEDLAKLIHGIALYLKSKSLEDLGKHNYYIKRQILFLQRLVRTYKGKTGRPDEYGFWVHYQLSLEHVHTRINNLIKDIPDPLNPGPA